MNNDDALYLLEIESSADAGTVRQAYERRRLEFEQRLTNATSSGLKDKYHTTLSDLDQAYQMLMGIDPTTRRDQRPTLSGANAKSLLKSASVSGASTGGTLLRSNVAASDTPNDLAIGQMLANRYEIRRVLGQGGMGTVYEAFDGLKQENVAIKALLPQFLSSEQGRDRFMHEAKVACRLSHPNIVKVFDVGLAEPYHFITMELLEGQTLRAQMEEKKSVHSVYSVAQVSDCARQLIAALEYAHKQIVHRDLKPENVWICEDGTLKLIDFGIARAFTKSALTRTGMVMGTAYYMAPEQFNGAKDVDWRADQYSLGVMLYELLAGRIPQGTFAATSALRKDVPLSLSRAVMRALSPDPADRFESLSAFSVALSSRDAPRALLKKSTRWIAAASLATLAIVGLWLGGVFNRFSQHSNSDAEAVDVAKASPLVDAAPPVAASTTQSSSTAKAATASAVLNLDSRMEDEVLVLFKRLQEKDQALSDSIAQQLPRYDRAVADVQGARNSSSRAAAEAAAITAGRELQLRRETQQEIHAKIFLEPQWPMLVTQIRSVQSLVQANASVAAVQFHGLRDTLLGKLKLFADIEAFVRARADYFDAKRSWSEFSALHGGRPPHNPAIHAAENSIQTAIDHGEYANLGANVFPQLVTLYSQEAIQEKRSDGAGGNGVAMSTNSSQSSKSTTYQASSRSATVPTPPTRQEIRAEKGRIAAEKKEAARAAKCAKARRPSRSCPDVQSN